MDGKSIAHKLQGTTMKGRWRPFSANKVALVLPYTSIFLFPVQQRAVITTPITPSVEEFTTYRARLRL